VLAVVVKELRTLGRSPDALAAHRLSLGGAWFADAVELHPQVRERLREHPVHQPHGGPRQRPALAASALLQVPVQVVDRSLVHCVELAGSDVRRHVAPDDVAVVGHSGFLYIELSLLQPDFELGGDAAVRGEGDVAEGVQHLPLGLECGLLRGKASLLALPTPALGRGRQVDDIAPAGGAVGELVGVDRHRDLGGNAGGAEPTLEDLRYHDCYHKISDDLVFPC
jgi:hypothetical protein